MSTPSFNAVFKLWLTPPPVRFIFLEADKSLKIPKRKEAKENVERLLRFVKMNLSNAKGGVSISIQCAICCPDRFVAFCLANGPHNKHNPRQQ